MPFVLSDARICDQSVPVAWKPVLVNLSRFLELEKKLRKDSENEALIREIRLVHEQLVTGSNELLEPEALRDIDEETIDRIFARSVFLTMRIAESVTGDDEILDTADCRTLHLYEADFFATDANRQRVREALERTVELDAQQLDEVEKQVELDVQQSTQKHKLVRAIRDQFGLWDSSPQLRQNIFRFFEALYPGAGLVPEEVELIATGTMIFFCLPFSKDELTTQRFQALPTIEQQPTREFLKRVNRFSQWQFAHFPVFGFRRGMDLDPELLISLAERSGLETSQVAEEISTLTAIIPIAEMEKYVVHDIFGHSWQACMLNFDSLYQQLATYADPLELNESAKSPGSPSDHGQDSSRISFHDCFVGDGDQLLLDHTLFRRFVDLEVAERLPPAMAPVLAEILADVAEFKLVDTQTSAMASSSVLASFPAKLDLTMRDVFFYFAQATKVFRLWASRSSRRQRTVDQLVARGATVESATSAVQHAVEDWKQLAEEWCAAELQFKEEEGQLHTNIASRIALNFLAIHRETLRVYEQLGSQDLGDLPLKGLRDLMLIAAAVFFEESPTKNLWRIDEFLTLKIKPLCVKLATPSQAD